MFDGIHAENTDDSSKGFVYLAGGTFDIASQQDGISASAWLQADDGTYTILTGASGASVQNGGEEMPMEPASQKETDTTSIKGMKASVKLVLKVARIRLMRKMMHFIPMEILLSAAALIRCHQEMTEFMRIPM